MKKILIIDDDTSILQVLYDNLTAEGFSVLVAQNGEEGLKMAKREHPDLILLDIIMPQMDGLEMLQQLRKDTWGKTANVIILTNFPDKNKIADAVEFGAYDYILKTDWPIDNIVSRVKEMLR